MIQELHDGRTAGGFFALKLTMHLDETGTLFELTSPRPADQVPRTIALSCAQARELAAALLEGIAQAEATTTHRCNTCGDPIVGDPICAICEVSTARTRRANLRIVSQPNT